MWKFWNFAQLQWSPCSPCHFFCSILYIYIHIHVVMKVCCKQACTFPFESSTAQIKGESEVIVNCDWKLVECSSSVCVRKVLTPTPAVPIEEKKKKMNPIHFHNLVTLGPSLGPKVDVSSCDQTVPMTTTLGYQILSPSPSLPVELFPPLS